MFLLNFNRTFRLIVFGLLLILVNSAGSEIIKEKISITMQDGTELSAHLYYPAGVSNLPVILIRSPYGKEQYHLIANKLAENDYIVISQDARGTGESKGQYIAFVNEANDGLETIKWIKEQNWYYGKIGMWGASYSAYCAGVLNDGILNSVFSISGGTNLEKSLMPGGAFNLMMNMTWLHFSKKFQDTSLNRYKPTDLMLSIPVIDGFKKIGADIDIEKIGNWLGSKDNSAKQNGTAYLYLTGWYDFFNVLTFDQFEKSSVEDGLPRRIIVGPWCHDQIYKQSSKTGDENFGPEAVMGFNKLNELVLQWFDYSIKGKQNLFSHQKNVKVFVMNTNTWEEFDSFKPAGSEEKVLYLTSDGNANGSDGNGLLISSADSKASNDSYIFDPMNPVQTYGGALFHFYPELLGVKDQSEIEKRKDILVYSTGMLNENMKIIGNVKAELYVSTEGINTDFTAKLVEVKQNGYAKIINDGIIRMTSPFGPFLTPGKIYKIEIDLGYTAIEIPAGSRIRLDISSSNFPKYDRNPNTGKNPLFAAEFIKVKQTVYYGNEYPSKLVFRVAK